MDNLQTSDASAASAAGAVPAVPAVLDLPIDLTERLRTLRDALLTGLVERDVAIRLALLAALAGEHLLLVGPPGTAKSVLARRLHLAFADASYFERLLTKFSVPEELFGPLSIKGLEQDRYERQTDRYLPTASVAFLDEIFKANSAILNALLTLLNEREFDNGAERVRTPLVSVVGASNELAEGEELDALFDRFLLRLHVGPVSSKGFHALLALRGDAAPAIEADLRLTADDLAAIQAAALRVDVPDDLVALLSELREWCAAEGIVVSDRRWRKVVKLLQVSALTNGRTSASVWDAWLLQHCLWSDPEDAKKIYDWYAARVGATRAGDPSSLTRLVVALEARLERDRASRSQMMGVDGRPLFRHADGSAHPDDTASTQAKRGNAHLFLAPLRASTNSDYDYEQHHIRDRSNGGKGFTRTELDDTVWVNTNPGHYRNTQFKAWDERTKYLGDPNNWLMMQTPVPPAMEPTRFDPAQIVARLRDVDALAARVTEHVRHLRGQLAGLEGEILSHLWVTPEFARPASEALLSMLHETQQLATRVSNLREGIQGLPVLDEAFEGDNARR